MMLNFTAAPEVGKRVLVLETAIYKADTIAAINRHQSSSRPYALGIRQLEKNLENIAEAEAEGKTQMVYNDYDACFILEMIEDLY